MANISPLEHLWHIVMHYGIPEKIINMIELLYEDYTGQVIHGGRVTDSFHVSTWGKTRLPSLSPYLHNST